MTNSELTTPQQRPYNLSFQNSTTLNKDYDKVRSAAGGPRKHVALQSLQHEEGDKFNAFTTSKKPNFFTTRAHSMM